jgi:hypothetical protein
MVSKTAAITAFQTEYFSTSNDAQHMFEILRLPLYLYLATSIPPDRKVTDRLVLIGSSHPGDIHPRCHWSHPKD